MTDTLPRGLDALHALRKLVWQGLAGPPTLADQTAMARLAVRVTLDVPQDVRDKWGEIWPPFDGDDHTRVDMLIAIDLMEKRMDTTAARRREQIDPARLYMVDGEGC